MKTNERGSAMVLTLLIVMALSIIGASLTVLALSETYGSMNYRLMSQARYGAESGIQQAAHFLLNSYVTPGDVTDPLAAYDMTTSPVKVNNAAVVLSAMSGTTGNYPIGTVQTAFQGAATGSLVTGNANVQYGSTATLLSMRQVQVYGTIAPMTIQTWLLTATGTTTGARSAQVEVTATMERQMSSLYNYAVFATAPGCTSLKFGGGAVVDSYDSGAITYQGGNVVTQQYSGNVGSNGNLNEGGNNTTIYGTMSTPRTGVGNCSASGVNAWTSNGGANVTGGLTQLPQALVYPTPAAPNPMPPTTALSLTQSSTCTGITGCAAGTPSGLVLPPGTYGDIHLSGQAMIHLTTGTYTLNSIDLTGNSTVIVDSGPVVLNVAGANVTTPVDFSGGTITNASLDSSWLQIQYAGTNTIKLVGGSTASGTVYAPNAQVQFAGGSDWYGAVIAATFDDQGGTKVHNDRRLANEFFTVGNHMLSAFSWKKY